MPRILLVVLAIFLGASNPALAHKLSLFAIAEGTEIVGKVTPPGARVRVETPDGTLLGRISVGPDGAFRFPTTEHTDHIVLAETDDGHAERVEIHHEHLTGNPVESSPDASQIIRLRHELAEFREEIRFRDVIGGVGYIFGIVGLVAWFSARRRKESDT